MLYERKIKYFSYVENGERVRGTGFVRLEVRDKLCFLTLQMNNLGVSNYSRPVFLLGGGRECQLCELQIKQGRGMMQFQLPRDNLCGGISYGELRAIRMPIAPGKEVYCEVQEQLQNVREVEKVPENKPGGVKGTKMEPLEVKAVETMTEEIWEPRAADTVAEEILEAKAVETLTEKILEAKAVDTLTEELLETQEIERMETACLENGIMVREAAEEEREAWKEMQNDNLKPDAKVILQENKWKQLSEIYKHIAPFQDEREYLSIGPGDFVIFTEKYYKLVNNSFLLHGYYNYKHLILTQMTVRGETRYYMGVPGNFYEREKQVALMFGFESFECREEPARAGDYGYYMMRVEL